MDKYIKNFNRGELVRGCTSKTKDRLGVVIRQASFGMVVVLWDNNEEESVIGSSICLI